MAWRRGMLVAGLLPGLSLAVPFDRSLPIILIVLQSAVFAGMYLLLFVLQKTGGPVLLSLLDRWVLSFPSPSPTGWPATGPVYPTRPKRFRSRCCGNSAAAGMGYADGSGWPRLSGRTDEFSAGSVATRAGFRATHWQRSVSFAVCSSWVRRKRAFILPIFKRLRLMLTN